MLADFDAARIAAALRREDAAVGYWRYVRAEIRPGTKLAYYVGTRLCAFVLRSDGTLRRVELGRVAAIDEAVPILGVCLGAQLIANTLGTVVYHGRVKEIGWSPVSITPHGQLDSLLGYLPETATVFQWHGDGFDLPAGAIRLASSVNYENQAFRLGRNIYGLQFHLEVTPRMVARWVDERSKDLAQAPYILPDKILADTQSYAPALKYYGERFLSEFIRRVARSKKVNGSQGSA